MPGKSKETMDLREMVRHLRQGQSNRAVARALKVNRQPLSRCQTFVQVPI